MKTLKINDTTHTELTKIKGLITSKTGKETTYDDAILWLIQNTKKKTPPNSLRRHKNLSK